MRWLFLTLITALGLLAFIDMLGRAQPLMATFPARGQLQFEEVTLAGLDPVEVCRAQRRGGEVCRWEMRLQADDARSWRLLLEPLVERQDHRYALLQQGDRLRLGIFQGRAYTLQRLTASAKTPGLEAAFSLLGEAELYSWRYHWLVVQALWLMLDVLAITAVLYLLWHRQRFITPNQQWLAQALVLAVLACTLWGLRPQPLPGERALTDLPVRFFAIAERLECISGWSWVARCQPQRFLLDDQARVWPLAYPASHSLGIERGAMLELGVHGGKVYRIVYAKPDPEQSSNCGYRQNPMSRRNQVVWICEDALELIESGRNPLATLRTQTEQRLTDLRYVPPMPYSWTEQAYLELCGWHNRRFLLIVLALGGIFVVGLLSQGSARNSRKTAVIE